MSISASSISADRIRIRELEEKLDLTQEQLNEEVRQVIARMEQLTAAIREELASLYEKKAKELRSPAIDPQAANGEWYAPVVKAQPKPASLAKSSAREACIAVLRDSGALHFSDVAREAVARGYGGGELDPESETVQSTFRRTLGKWEDLFKRTAPGTYQLADGVDA